MTEDIKTFGFAVEVAAFEVRGEEIVDLLYQRPGEMEFKPRPVSFIERTDEFSPSLTVNKKLIKNTLKILNYNFAEVPS